MPFIRSASRLVTVDIFIVALAYLTAVVLRVGGRVELAFPDEALQLAISAALLQVMLNGLVGVYRPLYSLDTMRDLARLLIPSLLVAVLLALYNAVAASHPIPYAAIPTGAALAAFVEGARRIRTRYRAIARAAFGRDLGTLRSLPIGPEPDVERTVIPVTATIRDAIEAIERDVSRIALVVDAGGRLVGTVTDGDARRAILHGRDLGAAAADIMSRHPVVATDGMGDDDVLSLMQDHAVRQIPVVDGTGHVVDVKLLDSVAIASEELTPVLIMAGGLGTRLGDMTRQVPKPLVRVSGRPILEMLVRDLALQGFGRIVIAVGYKAELIEGAIGDGHRFGVEITYLHEQEPLGTAGAIRLLSPRVEDDLLVTNADLLTRLNFREMLDFHRREKFELTVGVIASTYQLRYGLVETEGTRVTAIREKPALKHFVNAGIYVMNASVATLVPEGHSDMDTLINRALERGRVVGCFPIHELWMDIGEPTDLRRASEVPAGRPRAS